MAYDQQLADALKENADLRAQVDRTGQALLEIGKQYQERMEELHNRNGQLQSLTRTLLEALKAIRDKYETQQLHPDHHDEYKNGYMSALYDVKVLAQHAIAQAEQVARLVPSPPVDTPP